MIIDRTHRAWAIATAILFAAAIGIYVPYALRPAQPTGGSAVGLGYGVVGFGVMLFVALLSLRKKFPTWRIGRAQKWMRGHIWLGSLSFPLILMHAGFQFGHGLTAALMWLFACVWTSGLLGAWLQHTTPRRLLREVPMETIYDEIGHVRAQLLDEADSLVADACGRLELATAVPPQGSAGATALATVMRVEADEAAPLREFYLRELRPFLERPDRRHPLADGYVVHARVDQVRPLVPARCHPAIVDLEHICEEERQLLNQQRLERWLQGWLLVHVPLSFALMALAVVHIVVAMRY